MRFFRHPRLLVVGAAALILGLGATAAIGTELADDVFADDDEYEFEAVVDAMPPAGVVGTWQIGGRTVQVTESTEIDQEDGVLAVGARVEVEGTVLEDGSIGATEIEIETEDDD